MDGTQGSQLQLGFAPPDGPVTVGLTLSGLHVVAEGWASQTSLAWEYLVRAGVNAHVEAERGIVFPVLELIRLASLPDQVRLAPDVHLEPLVLQARSRSVDPAVVDVDGDGTLTVQVPADVGEARTFELTIRGALALLASELPFVATPAAWEVLDDVAAVPLRLGVARVTLDRYVEITTSKPQMVEAAPLPALWKVDDTRFGLPIAYADRVSGTPGFTWVGHPPKVTAAPRFLPPLPFAPVRGQGPDVRSLVDRLAGQRAAGVLWSSGLGRRVHALAAVEVLGLYPLLVVAPAWAVWLWRRHCQLVGRSLSLRPDAGDVRLVTYRDLTLGPDLQPPTSILFDSPTSDEASAPASRSALRTLDAFAHAYRIVVDRSWPSDEDLQDHLASLLRPAEFLSDLPRGRRYPRNSDQRRREHQQVYLLERDAVPSPTSQVHRSRVQLVDSTEEQRRELAALGSVTDRRERLAHHLQVLEVGLDAQLSPKVAAAAGWVRRHVADGHRVAVVTWQPATASRLRLLLTGVPDEQARVLLADGPLPDLRGADAVMLLSYPWSASDIDSACGPAGAPDGPAEVVVLHTPGTVDDRLSLLSSRRGDLARVQPSGLSDGEVDELLTPRTLF